jgi:hypothetical protein
VPHFGAPCFRNDFVHVPVQNPRGVWRCDPAGASQTWRKAAELPEGDLFAWCDVHPITDVLYTCNYRAPDWLRAYRWQDMTRRAQDDIRLGSAPFPLDRVQGGVFTARGRIILSCSDPNAIFCFSALNGYCFGGKHLGDFESGSSEVEGVTIRSWHFGQSSATVHVLELDNDWPDKDDCYLHSFAVPFPGKL